MGRDATKALGNPYFEARIEASKRIDRRFSSREGAADLIGLSADQLAKYEGDLCKTVPPESVWAMATGYGAPELINWYCSTKCPLGQKTVCLATPKSLEQVTLKLLHLLADVDTIQMALVEIACDGTIEADEIVSLREILKYFECIEQVIEEFKICVEKTSLKRVG